MSFRGDHKVISIGTDYDAYKETYVKYQRRVKAAAANLIDAIRPLMEK